MNTILEMRGITKRFPGVKALDNVNFRVESGEIHCLVGENGAGKSTLMKVLSGVHPYGSYEGDVVVNGSVQKFRSIADSEKQGIAIIYQELALIPELSVYENIFFGHEIMHGKTIDWNQTIVRATELMKKVGLDVDPAAPIRTLGVGQQQLVEIAKALSKNARIIIFDEPTAALNETDSQNLLQLMRQLKAEGVTCIMISHKLREIIAIADTITILRDGGTVCSMDARKSPPTEAEIIRNMVGREMGDIYPKRKNQKIGEVCFEVKNWSAYDNKRDRLILNNVNINVRRGEIVGIQGLMGAGRTEFALSVFGNTPNYKLLSGEVLLDGKPISCKTPQQAIANGIAYVSEDRKGNGLVLIQSVLYNINIARTSKSDQKFVVDNNQEVKTAEEYRDSLGIKTPTVEQLVGNLSGGNQQKVQLAKWMYVTPRILILDEPTRGIDVGAKHEIYTLMNKLVEEGMSIIMISSEMSEVLGMSDRIYVMSQGVITGEFDTATATEEQIMAHAINAKEEQAV